METGVTHFCPQNNFLFIYFTSSSSLALYTEKNNASTGAGELSVFCQSYFNKTLIGQAGSIGGKARQEVGVEQRDWEFSGTQKLSLSHSCADHRRGNM